MAGWRRVVRSGAVAAAVAVVAGVFAPIPGARATDTGCVWATDASGSVVPGALDLVSVSVATVARGSAAFLEVTLGVRSVGADLHAGLPADVHAASWQVAWKNNANRWPGTFSNPYLRLTVDRATATPRAEQGYVVSGQPVPYVGGEVVVVPGTPGAIVLSQELSTLSIAADNMLTDATAVSTTTSLGAGVVRQDEVAPSRTVYRVGLGRDACVDPLQPAQPTALSAAAFGDSVGVNVHLNYASYQDAVRPGAYAMLEQTLADLRIRHIREIWSENPAVLDELQRLATMGVRSTVAFGTATDSIKPTVEQAADYMRRMRDALAMVEGENEPTDVPGAQNLQRGLYAAAKADPTIAGIPIASPAINQSTPSTYQAMGDLASFADVGNVHDYPLTEPYSKAEVLDVFADLQRQITGDLPMVVTETGWNTFAGSLYAGAVSPAPHVAWCNTCATERAAAAYLPKVLLTNFAAGISRTFLYELLDEAPFAPPATSDHFGIVRLDFSPKPAYAPLRNLMTILADAGPGGTGMLPHSIDRPEIRHLLLQKTDGSFWLALWQDARLYTPEPSGGERVGPGDLTPPAVAATVSFDHKVTGEIYRVGASSEPAAALATSREIPVEVPADDVVILRLAPAPAAATARRR